jgi:hypothetical protein
MLGKRSNGLACIQIFSTFSLLEQNAKAGKSAHFVYTIGMFSMCDQEVGAFLIRNKFSMLCAPPREPPQSH